MKYLALLPAIIFVNVSIIISVNITTRVKHQFDTNIVINTATIVIIEANTCGILCDII